VDCDDENECTDDVCDLADGTCDFTPVVCDDRNPCTADTCDPADGCVFTAVQDGTGCGSGVCVDGECVEIECGGAEDCDDGNECTEDICNGGVCEYPPVEDGTACANGAGVCQAGTCAFACTEQGIRDAIAAGGGPHTFDCDGLTPVVTQAEIVIDNNVILDGEGNLTVDARYAHRVFAVASGVTAELRGMTITGGRPTEQSSGDHLRSNGGGVFNSGLLTVANSAVSHNTAPGGGGGIVTFHGELTVENSTVSGNMGTTAVGIEYFGTLTLTDSTVSANTGGGIEAGVWVALTNSAVSENVGSGISARGIVQVMNSTVSQNTAGGIVGGPGTLIVMNSTVSGNTADEAGGGIRVHGDSETETEVFLVNSTVSGNTASNGSGIACFSVTLTLLNSTVTDRIYVTSGDATDPPASMVTTATLIEGACTQEGGEVTLTSNGYNIESPGDTCGFDHGTDLVSVTEGQIALGELAANGGPTMTHALGAESVAIDRIPAVDCEVTTDQRGATRPVGDGCDVGSFERQAGDQ